MESEEKKGSVKLPAWAYRPEIVSYVCDHYAGTEGKGEVGKRQHRIFIWEAGPDLVMGNTVAFATHLRERFGLLASPVYIAGMLHMLLRELGEEVKKGWNAQRTGNHVGEYTPPTPEVVVVGRAGYLPRLAAPSASDGGDNEEEEAT